MMKAPYKIEVKRLCKGEWGVTFTVEQQSFDINRDAWDTKAEAVWFARQFGIAIKKLLRKEK